MFHVELRQFPHVAREFNLTDEELRARVLGPLSRGEMVAFGDRRWAPERARVTIYEGPALGPGEIGMGRGWSNAGRGGKNVTEQLLEAERSRIGPGADQRADGFKREILARCEKRTITLQELIGIASDNDPELRVSDRLALVESAVWELLHHGLLTMLRPAADGLEAEAIPPEGWQRVLLAWSTWAQSGEPGVLLGGVTDSPDLSLGPGSR